MGDWEKKREDTRKALVRMIWGGRSRNVLLREIRLPHRQDYGRAVCFELYYREMYVVPPPLNE